MGALTIQVDVAMLIAESARIGCARECERVWRVRRFVLLYGDIFGIN